MVFGDFGVNTAESKLSPVTPTVGSDVTTLAAQTAESTYQKEHFKENFILKYYNQKSHL